MTELVEALDKELEVFDKVSGSSHKRLVLVFPPINSFMRLKLHELTKEKYSTLASFSVGSDEERRPVICRQQILAEWTLKTLNNPDVQQNAQEQPVVAGPKKPAQAIYVPRALRQAQNQPLYMPPNPIKSWTDEIEAMTGPVKAIPPLSDFLAFEASNCLTSTEKAFRRVVELGDFPKALKTSDLESVLHSGLVKIKDYYDLRWIDDNHALVIFSDEATAGLCLTLTDPAIKFRPFYEACEASKAKAKTFGLEDSEAFRQKQRPDTSTVMAKRMLSRALNNPKIKADEEAENVLRKARKAKEETANKDKPDSAN